MRSRLREARAEVSIETLAPGGEGVAHTDHDGERRALFVRGAVPGDRVEVRYDPDRRPARGAIVRLLQPGVYRAEAPCAVSVRCGGCDWMHVALEAQPAAHAQLVRACLPARWRGEEIAFHAAPAAAGARVRARLHVRASGGRAVVGMHAPSTNQPIEVERCLVLHPGVEGARRALGPLLEGAHGKGDAAIALGVQGRPVLDLTWSGALPPATFARFEQAVAGGTFAGIRAFRGEATRPVTVGDPTPWMEAADGAPLRLGAGGFGQATVEGNRTLVRRVAELARNAAPAGRVVELYAGAGNFTILLARDASELVAVESNAAACVAARENLASRGLRARVVEGDAAAYAWRPATQLLVLDPPRAGARAVAERLLATPVRHVLYIGCDPATLGRDLGHLVDGYVPRAIETFEMFPFTSHVETVVLLERDRAARAGRRGAA